MSCIKKTKVFSLVVAALMLCVTTTAFSQTLGNSNEIPAGPGRELIIERCVSCHALSILGTVPHKPDQWDGVIEIMIQRGAKISDSEFDTIVEYLAKNYSKPVSSNAAASPAKK